MKTTDLRPGLRVLQARLPLEQLGPADLAKLWRLMGRTGTVEYVTAQRTAYVRWDDGSRGGWTCDCLELVT